jgi:hypothetical protein
MKNLHSDISSNDLNVRKESAKKILENISAELDDLESSILQDTSFLGQIIEDSKLCKRLVEGDIHPRTHESLIGTDTNVESIISKAKLEFKLKQVTAKTKGKKYLK